VAPAKQIHPTTHTLLVQSFWSGERLLAPIDCKFCPMLIATEESKPIAMPTRTIGPMPAGAVSVHAALLTLLADPFWVVFAELWEVSWRHRSRCEGGGRNGGGAEAPSGRGGGARGGTV
jgi:hypothetical protein